MLFELRILCMPFVISVKCLQCFELARFIWYEGREGAGGSYVFYFYTNRADKIEVGSGLLEIILNPYMVLVDKEDKGISCPIHVHGLVFDSVYRNV